MLRCRIHEMQADFPRGAATQPPPRGEFENPVTRWFRNERKARMTKHDKHFFIALVFCLVLSAFIVVGAEGVVEHHWAQAPMVTSVA